MKIRYILILMLIAMASNMLYADDSGKSLIGSQAIGFDLRPSWVIPTNEFLKSKPEGHHENSASISPNIRYSFKYSPSSRQGRLYPTVYQGIGLSYSAFLPDGTLGNPVNVYVFQGARLASISSRLSLDYEWNFGVSAGWKNYNHETNPTNGAIGSKVNALINLGIILSYKLNEKWVIRAGVEGSHFSDGNTVLPNAGVNSCGARIGLAYIFNDKKEEFSGIDELFRRHWSYDLTVYGAARQRMFESKIVPGHFGIMGMNFAPMYGLNRYLRCGVSADFQYDESANLDENFAGYNYEDEPMFYRQPFKERFSAGLSLRAELTMPIFSINIGIGRNIIAKGKDTEIWYQSLALKAYVFKNSYLQIGYQLKDFHQPNNLMLGVGYSFGK